MNANKYKWILYAIVSVIIVTVGIQLYWNYKNYLNNKQQLINEVQISLDTAVDNYYAQLAEKTTLGLSLKGDSQKNILDDGGILDQISESIDESNSSFKNLDSLKLGRIEGVTVFKGFSADSLLIATEDSEPTITSDSLKAHLKNGADKTLDLQNKDFEFLTSKVVISISVDTLNMRALDSLFMIELQRKSIEVDHDLHFFTYKERMAFFKVNGKMPEEDLRDGLNDRLITESKSTFLPKNSFLLVTFSNTTKTLLSRIIGGILISLLLILAVISSLFYLLKVIRNQKQLSDIKNDLISNITHEFKTPIATIGVALEGIQNFDVINDKERTQSYLNMSNQQLKKLNFMVEKLLETASLDSNSLQLDKEPTDLVLLLKTLLSRFENQAQAKEFRFKSNIPSFIGEIDPFHFENALNNILDNAIKYGGTDISVAFDGKGGRFEISISDNGSGIPKETQPLVFDKFYRVPTGNTHDVKGFGIGLYYTKTIINRHGGTISLSSIPGNTTFKIVMGS